MRLLNENLISEDRKIFAMKKLLELMARTDFRQSPPELAREMFRLVRVELKIADPYKKVKDSGNRAMQALYTGFQNMIRNSKYPLQTAMRLAVAGNVIDFGPRDQLDITETINNVLHTPFAADDSEQLLNELENAETVLYIGDNCGEIVLDKLFLETLAHPNVTFVVRDTAVLNDATIEDARSIGLDRHVKLLTTGDDAPGAVWATTSDDFKKAIWEADVIISKGQGNLEGLLDVDVNIYFLLVVKCDHIGRRIGAKRGDYVIKYLKGNGVTNDSQ
ncbi:DUF89 family protein [candidate division KSB1 bacterium]|nr:DUF89 family protein [candidate division KSB1 bacterium]